LFPAKKENWPGLKIIRPGDGYTMGNAYNAASDIMLLELFWNMRKKYPSINYTIITGDRYLLKLSALLQEINSVSSNGIKAVYSSSIPASIFDDDEIMTKDFNDFFKSILI
jgi:hypothetical protein